MSASLSEARSEAWVEAVIPFFATLGQRGPSSQRVAADAGRQGGKRGRAGRVQVLEGVLLTARAENSM